MTTLWRSSIMRPFYDFIKTGIGQTYTIKYVCLWGNSCTQLLGRQSPIAQTRTCSIYPPAFVDETIRTLALLLPEHDRNIENWFAGHQAKLQKRQKLLLDPPARECVVGSDSGIHIDSQYAKRCTVPSAILRLSVLQTAQICHRL